MHLLKYKQDRRSVLFVVLCVLFLLIPFVLIIPVVYVPLWLIMNSLLCFYVCIINHNHVHNAIFQDKVLNKLFGIALSLAKGHTSAGVILAHNYNHHVYNGKKEDWIRPELAGNGPGIVRLIKFIFTAVMTMARGKRAMQASPLSFELIRQKRLEQTMLFMFSVTLLYIDGISFFLFVVTPWIFGVLFLVGVNLLQHDRCIPDSRFNHSRNFTSRVGNWLCFNNGYHTAHHMKPELHWSLLPELHHREIAPYIESRLEQPSILSFLTTNYLTTRCKLQGEEE